MSESENKHKSHKRKKISRRLRRRLKLAAKIFGVAALVALAAWAGSKADMLGMVLTKETSQQTTVQFSSESSQKLYTVVESMFPASVAQECLNALTETGFADVLTAITIDQSNLIHATTDDVYAVDLYVQINDQEKAQIYITHVAPKAVLTMATDIRFTKDEDHYTACVYNEEAFGIYDTQTGTITEKPGDRLIIAFDESLQNPSADISQPGFVQNNPLVVTVDEIVSEINTDVAEAKTKYDGKYVEVTGVVQQIVYGGTITKYYIYGKQESSMSIVCWQEGATSTKVTEGGTYTFLGQIREVSKDSTIEIADCQLMLEEDTNRAVIEISTAEQIYALGRILQSRAVQNDYIIKDITYDIQNDFALFAYPDYVNTLAEKTEYLQAASYKLLEDVEITLQKSAGPEYFTGIGSAEKVFKGTFDGNGKTITLSAKGIFDFSGISDYGTGLFGETKGAIIKNLNIHVVTDIKIVAAAGLTNVGVLVGDADQTLIENCKVTITNAVVGVEYVAAQHVPTNVGGIAGTSTFTTFKNCQVVMENATLKATGQIIKPAKDMGAITVGGILGSSGAGSSNSENIGRLGNQIYDCSLTSKNDVQTDVIVAAVETGKELTVGGIVGCSANNILIEGCTVEIEKGNISAVKTGSSDDAKLGTQAGGIIGRMEHTGEVSGCTVTGNYLTILSKSPNNVTCAGGVVGIDMGPYHRDINTINRSHFDGSDTSQICVEITTTNTLSVDKVIAAGGIVGSGAYIMLDCSVKNVTVSNTTANIGNPTTYVGEIAGFMSLRKTSDISGTGYNWFYNTFFKKRNPGLYECFSENVNVIKTENVQNMQY